MSFVKKWGSSLVGLFILLALLMVVLNLLSKAPGVFGTIGKDAKNLATEGTL